VPPPGPPGQIRSATSSQVERRTPSSSSTATGDQGGQESLLGASNANAPDHSFFAGAGNNANTATDGQPDYSFHVRTDDNNAIFFQLAFSLSNLCLIQIYLLKLALMLQLMEPIASSCRHSALSALRTDDGRNEKTSEKKSYLAFFSSREEIYIQYSGTIQS
jgi:hypothetical protein